MLDLRPLLAALYAGRRWIVIGAVAGMLLGVAAWFIKGPTYQGFVTIAVSQPRSGPSTISTAGYRALFENYSVAAAAIQKAGLKHGGRPMTPEHFIRYVLSIHELRNTTLLQIQIRLPDPALAASVANDVADRAIQLGRSLSQQDGTSLRDQLKAQRDDALKALQKAEKDVLDFKQANRLELSRTDIDALIRQRQTLLAIEVDLASEKARVATATAEQKARDPKLSLDRRIDQDPTLLEAARAQGSDSRGLIGLGLKTEELNPTYLRLDSEVAMSKTRIAQLERQRQAIFEASEAERKGGKLSDLYMKEINLARLESDRTLASKVYEDITLRYENARVDATSGSAQLQITDPALPTERPVSWSVVVWMILGGLVGALVFPAFAVTAAVARGIEHLATPR
jgi:uncharacterized protein involved in exopolysaccharide biosynthesis